MPGNSSVTSGTQQCDGGTTLSPAIFDISLDLEQLHTMQFPSVSLRPHAIVPS
jgi:hypothetical protein